jgi:hypothetical protein
MKIQTYTFSSVLAEREDYGRALKRMPEVSLFERCASLTKENQELKRRASWLTWMCLGLIGAFAIAAGLLTASLTYPVVHVERSTEAGR